MKKQDHLLECFVTLTVANPDGKIVKRRRFKSKSYVLAFLDWLYALQMRHGGGTYSIKDVAGANTALYWDTNYAMACAALITDDTWGIVIGSDNTAVTLTDYKMGTQIAHGIAAGQFLYGAVGESVPATIGTKRRFLMTRSFTNASGNPITVNEVGIYNRSSTGSIWCIIRDVIAGGQAVNDAQTMSITYEQKVTVP